MSKQQQKKYLKEIMEADEKDGLYMSKIKEPKEFFEEWEGFSDRYPVKIFPDDCVAFAKAYSDYVIAEKVKELEEEIKLLAPHQSYIRSRSGSNINGLYFAIKILKT